MSDQKNIQLNDDVMANATGGTGNGSNPAWIFKIGDWVTMPSRPKYGRGQVRSIELMPGGNEGNLDDWMYTVFFPEWHAGNEYTAPYTIFEKA